MRFVAWVTEFTASMAVISPAARSVESFFVSGPCAAEPSPGHPSPEEFPQCPLRCTDWAVSLPGVPGSS